MERKKKIKLIQLSLFVLGTLIIIFTYWNKDRFTDDKIISLEKQKEIEKQLQNEANKENVFYNIEYTGLDLSGNRYILKSDEAYSDNLNKNEVHLSTVHAIFYFKDGTNLNVWSNEGLYNNNTFDMEFRKNVRAIYQDSKLYAGKANFMNSKGLLTITEEVKINDIRGKMQADKLIFDINDQTLNISSLNDGTVNANVIIK